MEWKYSRQRHMDWRHLIRTGQILNPPFYEIVSGKFRCLQPHFLLPESPEVAAIVCKADPIESFQDFVQHLSDEHVMSTEQLEMICFVCQSIFTSDVALTSHFAQCEILDDIANASTPVGKSFVHLLFFSRFPILTPKFYIYIYIFIVTFIFFSDISYIDG